MVRVLRSQSRREEEEGEQLTGDNNKAGEHASGRREASESLRAGDTAHPYRRNACGVRWHNSGSITGTILGPSLDQALDQAIVVHRDLTTQHLLCSPLPQGVFFAAAARRTRRNFLDGTARAVARRRQRTSSVRAGGDGRHGSIHTSPTYTKYSACQK